MATFVLVHGAWHGGWCWRKVVPALRAAGHEVFTPTLTGLGERVHLAHAEVGLSVHIEDIVNVIEFEGLRDVMLVGHSYAGLVIAGVAGRRPELIARLIYLDAFMPEDGDSAFSLHPGARAQYESAARELGDGWAVPPPDPRLLGVVDATDLAWLEERLTPMPLRTHQERLFILDQRGPTVPAAVIRCTDFVAFSRAKDLARARGWPYHELATGHEAMITAPTELAALLSRLASS